MPATIIPVTIHTPLLTTVGRLALLAVGLDHGNHLVRRLARSHNASSL